jgi:hypothetical protein
MEVNFELLTVVEIPNWPLIHDCMMVFKRKVSILCPAPATHQCEVSQPVSDPSVEDDMPPLIDPDSLD